MDYPALTVENVSKNFGAVQAISDVSFEVEKGSLTCLIGPNGAGKSTLLSCIAGMQRQGSGRIMLHDRDVSHLRADRRARAGLATVFQGTQTLHQVSVLQNAMLGAHPWTTTDFLAAGTRMPRHFQDERSSRDAASASLRRVGIGDFEEESAEALPFGRLRLLALARALTQKPSVLLLDEPAAGLRDAEKEILIEVFIRLRSEGLTQVLVEHDMQFVNSLADRVVVLDHGSLIADDSPENVRRDRRVQAAYLGLEAPA